jgi:glycosyltransferase involved in cell wall biosynthesis
VEHVKIVHALGWYFPDSIGGTEVYVAGLTRRLRAAGHDVAVVAPSVLGESTAEYEGTPVFRYPIPVNPTRDEAQGLVAVRGAERLHAWLDTRRPDIFHLHSFVTGLGLFELTAARTSGALTLATHHLPSLGYVCRIGSLMQWGERPCDGICEPAKCAACGLYVRGMPKVLATAVGALSIGASRALGAMPGRSGTMLGFPASIEDNQVMQRRLTDVTDRMVVLNDTARCMLIANGVPAAKLALNRLGTSHERIVKKAAGPTATPVRFGLVGRLHRTKGILELARAVTRLPRDLRFTLDIYGPEPVASEQEAVEQMRRWLAGDARVTFRGPLSHDDVPGVLAALDVLCCPSTGFENGPTVAIEAIAAGTPVIGTRLGNLAELIEDGVTGRLVEPADDADLARALLEIATTPALVDTWRAALPRARTMDEVAADYMALYEELRHRRAVA